MKNLLKKQTKTNQPDFKERFMHFVKQFGNGFFRRRKSEIKRNTKHKEKFKKKEKHVV